MSGRDRLVDTFADTVRGGERFVTERDFEREMDNRQRAGRPTGHWFDEKCSHCVKGHRMPGRWTLEGPFGDTVQVAACECGQELRGDVIAEWRRHVREVNHVYG